VFDAVAQHHHGAALGVQGHLVRGRVDVARAAAYHGYAHISQLVRELARGFDAIMRRETRTGPTCSIMFNATSASLASMDLPIPDFARESKQKVGRQPGRRISATETRPRNVTPGEPSRERGWSRGERPIIH